jgi:multidrug transporter EmrE-like cation transporter
VNEPVRTGYQTDLDPDSQKGKRRMLIVLILASVMLAGVAQITLKSGVNGVTASNGGTLQADAASLRAVFTSPVVWAGLVLFGVSAILWIFALSRASLSFAYPFAAFGYVLIVAFSVFVHHETVPLLHWIGVACIVVGIILVAQTPHA